MKKDAVSQRIDEHLHDENIQLREELARAKSELERAQNRLAAVEARADKLAKDYWPQVGLISSNLAEVAGTLKQMLKLMKEEK